MSNRSFHFVPTFTRIGLGHGGWKGATASINAQLLSKHIAILRDPIYYVAGPPGMVMGARQTLVELAVPEKDNSHRAFRRLLKIALMHGVHD